jgi:predicted MPP superfamily phosphohydrolase
MKLWALVFFLLPVLGCAYVGWHVWRILPLATVWKWVVVLLMTACFALFILNFVIGLDRVPLPLARVMYNVGNSTLFILLYLFMLFLALDVVALVLHFARPSLGDEMRMGFLRDSLPGTLCVLGFMVVLFTYANLHYLNKVRVPMEIDTRGKVTRPLKLVLMSDLHLGYHNGRVEFAKWVDKVNAEQPDLVLIAGDIIDISVRPLLEENVAEEFKRIKAPIFACLGNHEYYSGEPRAQQFYRDAGIHLLRDSVVTLPDYGNLTIIGRDDRTNAGRKSVAELVPTPNPSRGEGGLDTLSTAEANQTPLPSGGVGGGFLLLLDHQPYHLERTAKAGIDFQFSGHTHYGQVWPISWIEDAIYECAYGSLTKGNTRFYVSSGIGIWGAKFRIGTQSEYVVLTLK